MPFEVIYTTPTQQRLQILAPQAIELDLLKVSPVTTPLPREWPVPSFMENSGDGNVSGPIFYLNHGGAEDWQAFDALHVDDAAGLDRARPLGVQSRSARGTRASTQN